MFFSGPYVFIQNIEIVNSAKKLSKMQLQQIYSEKHTLMIEK